MLYNANAGDAEYRQAILELTEEYSTHEGTAMAMLQKDLMEYLRDYAMDAGEEIVLDYAGTVATGYFGLAKVCTEVILKVTGVKDHGEAWLELYHRYSSQKILGNLYSQTVSDIRAEMYHGRTVPDALIRQMQSVFTAYREATARCFETLAKLDPAHKGKWELNETLVRARTLPGVD